MNSQQVDAGEFIARLLIMPVIDVRSPAEYRQGHVPGAYNIPLFDDEERKKVGIRYNKSGRNDSVLLGLELIGGKLADYVKQLHQITSQKEILVHCWRGGMRSESMAWLFRLAGYKVNILTGGYRAYRKKVREGFENESKMIIIGGMTGSGKTSLLTILAEKGMQVLDLEGIAHHKGSVFGALGQQDQPTNEQFENDLFSVWNQFDSGKIILTEDESFSIGNVTIPQPLFDKMQNSPLIKIEMSRHERIRRLVEEYSKFDVGLLKDALLKIKQRLGGQNIKSAFEALDKKDFETVAGISLDYYDKTYLFSISKRQNQNIITLPFDKDDPAANAIRLMNLIIE